MWSNIDDSEKDSIFLTGKLATESFFLAAVVSQREKFKRF